MRYSVGWSGSSSPLAYYSSHHIGGSSHAKASRLGEPLSALSVPSRDERGTGSSTHMIRETSLDQRSLLPGQRGFGGDSIRLQHGQGGSCQPGLQTLDQRVERLRCCLPLTHNQHSKAQKLQRLFTPSPAAHSPPHSRAKVRDPVVFVSRDTKGHRVITHESLLRFKRFQYANSSMPCQVRVPKNQDLGVSRRGPVLRHCGNLARGWGGRHYGC